MSDTIVRYTADVVLLARVDGDLHVLLIRRAWDPHQGMWALPGGHIDPGEDSEAAARRELVEETGLVVYALQHVGRYDTPGRDLRGQYTTDAYVCLLPDVASVADLAQPTAGDDAAAAQWMPVDDAIRDGLAFDHEEILEGAVQKLGI